MGEQCEVARIGAGAVAERPNDSHRMPAVAQAVMALPDDAASTGLIVDLTDPLWRHETLQWHCTTHMNYTPLARTTCQPLRQTRGATDQQCRGKTEWQEAESSNGIEMVQQLRDKNRSTVLFELLSRLHILL